MVEDATPAQEDMPEAAEEEEVTTGGQEVVQAEVHGGAEDYPLENEEEEEEEEDEEKDEEEEEEEDKEDPEWDAEVARQQEIRLIKIRVCFNSSG